jgi:hypothetical protein
MRSAKAFWIPAMLTVLLISSVAVAQDTRPGRVKLGSNYDSQLLTLGNRIYAQLPPDSLGVEFSFQPATRGDVRAPAVVLGVDYGHMEPTYGPDCGGPRCEKRVFSVQLDKQLKRQPEGWGQLVAREIGTGEEASVRVYWDDTPPVANFLTPQFNEQLVGATKFHVVAHTFDEDIVSMNVFWQNVDLTAGGRQIPRFEQHDLGFDFAAHAACVPTTVGANLKWLDNIAGQADTIPSGFSNSDIVHTLGTYMDTDTGGTSGDGAVAGTIAFLLVHSGYLPGYNYTLQHLGSGDAWGTYGFTPIQMLLEFTLGGTISLGFHNLSSDSGFGHFLALSNVLYNADGTAWIIVMDPNVEPNPGGVTQGQYRWFKLHTNGKIDWTAANPGYYSPASGKVKLDELLILRSFSANGIFSAIDAKTDDNPSRGQVVGRLTNGGRTFVGDFTPPAGSSGPWLLISESTHAAGHTQRAVQLVGARFTNHEPPSQ